MRREEATQLGRVSEARGGDGPCAWGGDGGRGLAGREAWAPAGGASPGTSVLPPFCPDSTCKRMKSGKISVEGGFDSRGVQAPPLGRSSLGGGSWRGGESGPHLMGTAEPRRATCHNLGGSGRARSRVQPWSSPPPTPLAPGSAWVRSSCPRDRVSVSPFSSGGGALLRGVVVPPGDGAVQPDRHPAGGVRPGPARTEPEVQELQHRWAVPHPPPPASQRGSSALPPASVPPTSRSVSFRRVAAANFLSEAAGAGVWPL